jgi:hypothetical protein
VQSSALCVLQVNILLWVLRLKLNALHVQLGSFPERVLRCAQIVMPTLIALSLEVVLVLSVCAIFSLLWGGRLVSKSTILSRMKQMILFNSRFPTTRQISEYKLLGLQETGTIQLEILFLWGAILPLRFR